MAGRRGIEEDIRNQLIGHGFTARTTTAIKGQIKDLGDRFKAAMKFINTTGEGIYSPEWETQEGKKKIEAKRDEICPYYMLFLGSFGTRAGFMYTRKYQTNDVKSVRQDFGILLGTNTAGDGGEGDEDISDEEEEAEGEGDLNAREIDLRGMRRGLDTDSDNAIGGASSLGTQDSSREDDDNHLPTPRNNQPSRSRGTQPNATTTRRRDTAGYKGKGAIEGGLSRAFGGIGDKHDEFLRTVREGREEDAQRRREELELRRREVVAAERESRLRGLAQKASAIADLIKSGLTREDAVALWGQLEG